MSSHNEKVQPAQFDLAATPQTSDQTATAASTEAEGTPSWVLPGLGGLLLVAAIVVFWLPGRVTTPDSVEAPVAADSDANPAPVKPVEKPVEQGEEASPWSDAQSAKLRKEAQDTLGELLDVQFRLQEREVERWAPAPFAEATAEAQRGDELYKERQFVEAKESYESALAALLALEAGIPDAFAAQMEAARSAIEQGNAAAAAEALELAELIEPAGAGLQELRRREAAMPEVQQLLASAQQAEEGGDLAAAERHLKKANTTDPAHQRVAGELARVSEAYVQQQFNDAMSNGYMAMDDGRFDNARSSFRQADKLQPGSPEAASAMLELASAETAAQLASLQRRGSAAESSESWKDAVEAYQAALEIDGNILFAREGLTRAEPRARLDKQFQAAIDEPDRLADVAVAELTESLIKQARSIQPQGPVLAEQLRKLEGLLELANTPITVTLQSDLQTEVIVHKVARLGRFEQRQLTLRPGKYTAVGTRNGYRDTRQTFEIRHDTPMAPIVVACTETI